MFTLERFNKISIELSVRDQKQVKSCKTQTTQKSLFRRSRAITKTSSWSLSKRLVVNH